MSLSLLLSNTPLMAALAGMIGSQLIKLTQQFIQRKPLSIRSLFSSGGMPSTHSSMVAALTTSIALVEGLDSMGFALSLALSLIIVYDASGVRQEVDKQAKIIQGLTENPDTSNTSVGHTQAEVIVGIVLGIVIACIMVYY